MSCSISDILLVIIVVSAKVWFKLGCQYDQVLNVFCFDNIMRILIVVIKNNDNDSNSNVTGQPH